ncbi:MAG: hypothetical protein WC852_05495 [Candidatus Nanoarchaeia archaeon]|jgi:hypothetical protein
MKSSSLFIIGLILAIILFTTASTAVYTPNIEPIADQIKPGISGFESIPVECRDTDNGLNLAVKGSYYNGTAVIADECKLARSNLIYETFCAQDCNCQRILLICPFTSMCKEGACVYETKYNDTDNNRDWAVEYNIFRKGTSTALEGTRTSYTDYCEHNSVIEYGSYGGSKTIKCPEGMRCEDGACVGASVTCNTLIMGLNADTDNRYNIVFVGTDYHKLNITRERALEMFKGDAKKSLGIESPALGLFSIEPFKSNINKFNFWYVDRFVESNEFIGPAGRPRMREDDIREGEASLTQRGVASACSFNNKIIISLDAWHGWNTNAGDQINFATYRESMIERPEAMEQCISEMSACYEGIINERDMKRMPISDLNSDGCISREDLKYPDWTSICQTDAVRFRVCSAINHSEIGDFCGYNHLLGEGVGHEMAHFFGLADESAAADSDVSYNKTIMPPLLSPNCFAAETAEECEEKAPWRYMLGNGCGENNTEDCNKSDPDFNREVTCFPGCISNIKSYRSIRYGIMPYGRGLTGLESMHKVVTLGEWVEWFVNQRIQGNLEVKAPVMNLSIEPTRLRITLNEKIRAILRNALIR